MSDFGIKRNGSGYLDLVAYEAIKAADLPRPGEIYSIQKRKEGIEEEFLIITSNEKYINCLRLSDTPFNDNCVKVISKTIKYTDPGMLSYTFSSNPMVYVKRISFEEFENIMDIIAAHFNIIFDLQEQVVNNRIVEADNNESEKVIRLEADLNTYKHLYEDLLSRMLAK